MRKLLLAVGCMLFMAGAMLAADTVTFKSYDKDKKTITVTDKDSKDQTYKLTDSTKYMSTDKDGNKTDAKFADVEKTLTSDKAAGKAKFDVTVKDGEVTELSFKKRGK